MTICHRREKSIVINSDIQTLSNTVIELSRPFRMAIASPAHITAQKVVAKRYLMMKEMDEEIIPELKRATSRHVRKAFFKNLFPCG